MNENKIYFQLFIVWKVFLFILFIYFWNYSQSAELLLAKMKINIYLNSLSIIKIMELIKYIFMITMIKKERDLRISLVNILIVDLLIY